MSQSQEHQAQGYWSSLYLVEKEELIFPSLFGLLSVFSTSQKKILQKFHFSLDGEGKKSKIVSVVTVGPANR